MNEVEPLTPEQVADLSPGVRDLVVAMRAAGFHTMDSGDGSNHAEGMECAVPFAMVYVACPREHLADTADQLAEWILGYGLDWPAYTVEAIYKPSDGRAGVMLREVTDGELDFRESITGARPSGLC